jgi:hypothetical protein
MSDLKGGMTMDRTERVARALARMDCGGEMGRLWDAYFSFREKYLSRAADILALIDGEQDGGAEELVNLFWAAVENARTEHGTLSTPEVQETRKALMAALIHPPVEPGESDEPEEDADNETYMRGWQDAKADSVDPRSKRPCPGCSEGEAPVLLDEDGTLSSVSGNPGRPGHGADDCYWFCEDFVGESDFVNLKAKISPWEEDDR